MQNPGTMQSKDLFLMSGRGAIGSALALGARGCQFESGRPDQSSPLRATPGTASSSLVRRS